MYCRWQYIQEVLKEKYAEVEGAMQTKLASITLQDIVDDILIKQADRTVDC